MIITQPMLAASLLKPTSDHSDESILAAMKKLKMPVMGTLKKDGVRGLRMPRDNSDDRCRLLSRTFKLIPNDGIRGNAHLLPMGYDMELWNPDLDYNTIQSIVMSKEHPDSHLIQYHILDDFTNPMHYEGRMQRLQQQHYINGILDFRFEFPTYHDTAESLFARFKDIEESKGEGICFRLPSSPYKEGRSTLKEQYLVKLCRLVYQECIIIGFKEQMFNGNRDKYNDIGKMKRSSSLAAMSSKDTLGAFIVRNRHGLEFDVGNGVGLTDLLRKEVWLDQDKWLGKEIVIRSKAHGMKIKPRSPVYWGLREKGY